MPAAYQRNFMALDSAAAAVQLSVAHRAPEAVRHGAFQRARLAWKAVQFLVEYLSPSLAKQLNGSARPGPR